MFKKILSGVYYYWYNVNSMGFRFGAQVKITKREMRQSSLQNTLQCESENLTLKKRQTQKNTSGKMQGTSRHAWDFFSFCVSQWTKLRLMLFLQVVMPAYNLVVKNVKGEGRKNVMNIMSACMYRKCRRMFRGKRTKPYTG